MRQLLTRLAPALVLLAVATAHADKPPPTARPRAAPCRGEGTPIVEIDYLDVAPDAQQLTVVLYANGAQTAERTQGKERPISIKDCRKEPEMKIIKASLAAATWKVTHARITCKARTSKSTVVKIDGRTVITEQLCGGESLDETSAKKLAEVEAQLPTLAWFEKCLDNPLAPGCLY